MGMPEEVVEEIRRQLSQSTETVGIWRQNEVSVAAFLSITSQWRVAAGMKGLFYLGLDYASALAGIEAAGMEVTPELWTDVRLMERTARDALNGIKG